MKITALYAKARAFVAGARKAVTGAAGVAAALLAGGLLPSPYDRYVSIGLGALTVLGVYGVPNASLATIIAAVRRLQAAGAKADAASNALRAAPSVAEITPPTPTSTP